jgi:hypothetical protein
MSIARRKISKTSQEGNCPSEVAPRIAVDVYGPLCSKKKFFLSKMGGSAFSFSYNQKKTLTFVNLPAAKSCIRVFSRL